MAQREVVVLVCDLCGGEDVVQTHTLAVDGHAVEVDACEHCWQDVLSDFAQVAKAGRRVKQKRIKKVEVMPFPGTAWDFTSHALKRMGERHIKPLEAALAADDPEVRSGGRKPGTEIRRRGGVKVAVLLNQPRILTVAGPEEEIDQ